MKSHAVYAVSTNPTLDLSGHVSQIIPNEKNDVSRSRIDPGGNAINAARIADRLGGKPLLLGFVGGPTGEQLRCLLDDEGILHSFTTIKNNTRTNVTVTNDEDCQQTRLTFPGPTVSKKEISALLRSIRSLKSPGLLVLGGKSPHDCPHDFLPRLIRLSSREGLGVIVDVPAAELGSLLKADLPRLLLIKPNLTEFQNLIGRSVTLDLEIAKEACELLSRSEMVCVSLGQRGTLLAWNHQAWLIQSPPVQARGTVGTGDSMIGAISARLAQQGVTRPELCRDVRIILDTVKWGVAAGAATATAEGTALGNSSLIRRLHPQVTARLIWQKISTLKA